MAMAINVASMRVSRSLMAPSCSGRGIHAQFSSSSSFDPLHCSLRSRLSAARSRRIPASLTSASGGLAFSGIQGSGSGRVRQLGGTWQLAVSSSGRGSQGDEKEEVFFDGGPHYGDLVTNLVFGITLVWLPLTAAAVFRALFLRYRFTNLRVTIMSGLLGDDRKDFSYEVIKDVQYIPRFIGEWGDMVITLKDNTKVEMKSIPKFREIAKYCLDKAGKKQSLPVSSVASTSGPKGF